MLYFGKSLTLTLTGSPRPLYNTSIPLKGLRYWHIKVWGLAYFRISTCSEPALMAWYICSSFSGWSEATATLSRGSARSNDDCVGKRMLHCSRYTSARLTGTTWGRKESVWIVMLISFGSALQNMNNASCLFCTSSTIPRGLPQRGECEFISPHFLWSLEALLNTWN